MDSCIEIGVKKIPVFASPGISYLELSNCFLALFTNGYFICLLRRPFFHVNLRILLFHFSLCFMFLSGSRFVLLLNYFGKFLGLQTDYVLSIFHDSFIYVVLNCSVVIACERILASVWVDSYEKARQWWIASLLTTTSMLMNGGIAYFVYLMIGKCVKIKPGRVSGSVETDYVLLAYLGIFLLNAGSLLAFVLIRYDNEKKWKNALRKRLTHKYQIMENIRTAKQLLVALLIAFALSVFLSIFKERDSSTDVGNRETALSRQLAVQEIAPDEEQSGPEADEERRHGRGG
ncbi:hypothetical protein L596_013980 [Steinernema carpocapsae]|uniref:G-protein coupled receptors family 1 profile domain-containing protein n=1 Tax=Steinernema carpocapsae TaxID=34508 RepID=A0A4V6A2M9_STECR|nr:hypothetical protein L596_013980 [Steinernema carpocapsae]